MKSGAFFLRKNLFFGGALGLGLTCLGLEPALVDTNTQPYTHTFYLKENHVLEKQHQRQEV